MRRRIEKEEGFTEAEVVESWSKKRIGVALLVVFLMGVGVMYAFSQIGKKATEVLGSQVGPQIQSSRVAASDVSLPSSTDAKELLETAKKELEKITSENVSASDGALQKVITDLQNVQSGKESPVDALCKMVCKQ